jgi:hypothetical protein
MRRVQVFDVNETLLDLAAMDRHFQQIFGDPSVREPSWSTPASSTASSWSCRPIRWVSSSRPPSPM